MIITYEVSVDDVLVYIDIDGERSDITQYFENVIKIDNNFYTCSLKHCPKRLWASDRSIGGKMIKIEDGKAIYFSNNKRLRDIIKEEMDRIGL